VRKMLAENPVETKREEPPQNKSSKRTKEKKLLGKRK